MMPAKSLDIGNGTSRRSETGSGGDGEAVEAQRFFM